MVWFPHPRSLSSSWAISTFKRFSLQCTYSSTLVKVLWDIGREILTSIAVCP